MMDKMSLWLSGTELAIALTWKLKLKLGQEVTMSGVAVEVHAGDAALCNPDFAIIDWCCSRTSTYDRDAAAMHCDVNDSGAGCQEMKRAIYETFECTCF